MPRKKMYENVYAELDAAGCTTIAEIRESLERGRLSQSTLSHDFHEAKEVHDKVAKTTTGITLVSDAGKWPSGEDSLKKSLVVGNINYIQTDDVTTDAENHFGGYVPERFGGNTRDLKVWAALLRYRKPVESGLAYIVPYQLCSCEGGSHASYYDRRLLPKKGVDLEFDAPGIRQYFTGRVSGAGPVLRIEPILPNVEGLSLDAVLALRVDHGGSYRRFQNVVSRKLGNAGELTVEREFLDILVEIDDSVRRLEESHEIYRKKSRFRRAQIASGLAGLGICLTVDVEFAKALGSFLGAVGVRDLLKHLDIQLTERAQHSTDPYHFPWLVHSRAFSDGRAPNQKMQPARKTRG